MIDEIESRIIPSFMISSSPPLFLPLSTSSLPCLFFFFSSSSSASISFSFPLLHFKEPETTRNRSHSISNTSNTAALISSHHRTTSPSHLSSSLVPPMSFPPSFAYLLSGTVDDADRLLHPRCNPPRRRHPPSPSSLTSHHPSPHDLPPTVVLSDKWQPRCRSAPAPHRPVPPSHPTHGRAVLLHHADLPHHAAFPCHAAFSCRAAHSIGALTHQWPSSSMTPQVLSSELLPSSLLPRPHPPMPVLLCDPTSPLLRAPAE